jgi:hypothetical protein
MSSTAAIVSSDRHQVGQRDSLCLALESPTSSSWFPKMAVQGIFFSHRIGAHLRMADSDDQDVDCPLDLHRPSVESKREGEMNVLVSTEDNQIGLDLCEGLLEPLERVDIGTHGLAL